MGFSLRSSLIRVLCCYLALAMAGLLSVPKESRASFIYHRQEETAELDIESLEIIRTALEKEFVAEKLWELGLTEEEIIRRVEELSSEEQEMVLETLEMTQAGGQFEIGLWLIVFLIAIPVDILAAIFCPIFGCKKPHLMKGLLQMGQPEAPPVAEEILPEMKRVFITSTTYSGKLSSFGGPDAICQSQADAAGLPGVFKAWISSKDEREGNATGEYSPKKDFMKSEHPYVLVDGSYIAHNWVDLIDGDLIRPINIDESGNIAYGDVWTSTWHDGSAAFKASDCHGWDSDSELFYGGYGLNTAANSSWTIQMWDVQTWNVPCDVPKHLYCFQQ